MHLRTILDDLVERYGQKTAIISGEQSLSYSEIQECSNKLANKLVSLGISKGDRIAIVLPNNLEYPVIYFGIAAIGAIAVPLDIKYRYMEFKSVFNNCHPKILISCSPYLEPLLPVLNEFESIEHAIDVSNEVGGQTISYQEIMDTGSSLPINTPVESEDTALIAYTSGPTLSPKGTMLTHYNLVNEAYISRDGFAQTDKDIEILFALPLHHMFGLVGMMLTSVITGSKFIIVPGLSIAGVIELIEKEKATLFMGVPYVFTLMNNIAEKEGITHDISSLRICGSAGSPLPKETAMQFKKYFGYNLIDFWGLTEATCHITCQSLNGHAKFGSVGKALPGWEIKIVDHSGNELVEGQDGEILARSVAVMKGYYNNPAATEEKLKDGWLHTGDIGRIDKDGNLFITGRSKDMIIRKGQNVYPSDIENILSGYEKVAEVAVVGLQDKMRGEVLRAVVKLKPGEIASEQDIRQYCFERIANYKVPKQVVFVQALPKTSDGRIDKQALKETLSSLSHLQ